MGPAGSPAANSADHPRSGVDSASVISTAGFYKPSQQIPTKMARRWQACQTAGISWHRQPRCKSERNS